MTPRLRPADKGWLVLWSWVSVFNGWAVIRRSRGVDCELLSEACERYLSRRRWPTELWLLAFYLHLSRHVPPRFDPIHWFNVAAHRLLRANDAREAPARRRRSQGGPNRADVPPHAIRRRAGTR